ncbi:MAG: PIN domain-containing protein [Deltaproteobacteria bacterium]|nr:PIN domain-containing protein [Deltaproteobacteria bacterium]
MKLMLDLNILLDVVQQRQPHYAASAQVLHYAQNNGKGCIASHAVTTLHYLVGKYAGRKLADELIDWLLKDFAVASADKETFLRARLLEFSDFEDAVVCACAEQQQCDYIISRNSRDFSRATVAVLSPGEFLAYGLGN